MNSRSSSTQPLLPGSYYHIYNRANGFHNLFFKKENYRYFLEKYARYTNQYIDTFAYCLLPNHFHFLIRPKTTPVILNVAMKDYSSPPKRLVDSTYKYITQTSCQIKRADFEFDNFTAVHHFPEDVISRIAAFLAAEQLRKLFMSYSKAVNKQMNRRGSLFQKYFRRKMVNDNEYLTWLVWYIHRNPLHHQIALDFRNYRWSSYQSLITDKPTQLERQEVYSWFGGTKSGFMDFHERAALDFPGFGNLESLEPLEED